MVSDRYGRWITNRAINKSNTTCWETKIYNGIQINSFRRAKVRTRGNFLLHEWRPVLPGSYNFKLQILILPQAHGIQNKMQKLVVRTTPHETAFTYGYLILYAKLTGNSHVYVRKTRCTLRVHWLRAETNQWTCPSVNRFENYRSLARESLGPPETGIRVLFLPFPLTAAWLICETDLFLCFSLSFSGLRNEILFRREKR